MTVKELIEKLNQYDDDMIIGLYGGENVHGGWADLVVGRMEHHALDDGWPGHEWDEFKITDSLMEYTED